MLAGWRGGGSPIDLLRERGWRSLEDAGWLARGRKSARIKKFGRRGSGPVSSGNGDCEAGAGRGWRLFPPLLFCGLAVWRFDWRRPGGGALRALTTTKSERKSLLTSVAGPAGALGRFFHGGLNTPYLMLPPFHFPKRFSTWDLDNKNEKSDISPRFKTFQNIDEIKCSPARL